jgi:hypothetical protein
MTLSKNIKLTLVISGIYLIFLALLIYLVYAFKWSLWVIVWAIVLPSVIGFIVFLVIKFRKNPQKEKTEDELPDIAIEEQIKYAISWAKNNELGFICDEPKVGEECRVYKPRQEGITKEGYHILTLIGEWGEGLDGFDFLLLALPTNKKDIKCFKTFKNSDENTMYLEFEKIVDKAVSNPMEYIETEQPVFDSATGSTRIIKKKTPIAYLKKEEEKKKAQEEEEEEGAGDKE